MSLPSGPNKTPGVSFISEKQLPSPPQTVPDSAVHFIGQKYMYFYYRSVGLLYFENNYLESQILMLTTVWNVVMHFRKDIKAGAIIHT